MSAVVVGRFSAEQIDAIRMALRRGSAACACWTEPEAAIEALRRPETPVPQLLVVDAALVELERFLAWLRADIRLSGTLVIAVVPTANDRTFAEAHHLGVDDVVVQGDLGGITRRAAGLPGFDPTRRPAPSQGRCLVAHPSQPRRRVLGRILRWAGYDVAFAENAEELTALAATGDPPTLAVVSQRLPQAGGPAAARGIRAAAGGAEVPTILVGTRHELSELRGEEPLPASSVTLEGAPPDDLLFVANELLRPDVQNLRSSRRLLYGALCAFRSAGTLHPSLGLTYNISREGLYVRTLDPPKGDSEVWLELRPPVESRVVHLRGRVAWVRRLSTGPGGAAPPGFGVRFAEAACPPRDLALYRHDYDSLAGRPRLVA